MIVKNLKKISFLFTTSFYQNARLQLPISKNDSIFVENKKMMDKINHQYIQILNKVTTQTNFKALEKLKKVNKLPVRERIQKLLDVGSPFLQLSPLAGYAMYNEQQVNSGGIVTGIGLIQNKFCMIVANDPTVKGGTYYPITVRKHIRAQQIALQNKLPCFYLVDSGGANLPRQNQVFPDENHFGRIFYNMAQMSAQKIPQISMVLGSCTAGGAYVPAMSDESIIVHKNGTIFLAGPPLVKAAIGQVITSQQLGGAQVHTKISGVSDHLANSEEEALWIGRNIAKNLNCQDANFDQKDIIQPLYDIKELNYLCSPDFKRSFDCRFVLARILDGSEFQQYKKEYGATLVCGFGRIHGQLVGIVANNGILFSQSAQKGANFIEICSQRQIPLVFLQNINGFMVGKQYEHQGIAKHGSKMVNAVATTGVPKITLIIGASYGAGNYGMCGRAYNPRFLFMWPSAKIAVMGGEQASNVLIQVKSNQLKSKGQQLSKQVRQQMKQEIISKYQQESNCFYSTARLWDDGVILPQHTRHILALSLFVSSRVKHQTKHGIFRM